MISNCINGDYSIEGYIRKYRESFEDVVRFCIVLFPGSVSTFEEKINKLSENCKKIGAIYECLKTEATERE